MTNEHTPTKWSIETLRDYVLSLIYTNDKRCGEAHTTISELIAASEARFDLRFAANDRAVTVAHASYREYLAEVLKERDVKYENRYMAQQEASKLEYAHFILLLNDHDKLDTVEHNRLRESLSQTIQGQSIAIGKAEIATEKRFDAVNEFRATLADQQRLLIPRIEVDVLMRSIQDKLDGQTRTIKEMDDRVIAIAASKTGVKEGWGWAVGIIGLVLTLLAISGMFNRNLVPVSAPVTQQSTAK